MSRENLSSGRYRVRASVRRILLAGALGAMSTTAFTADAAPESDALDQVVVTGRRLGQTGLSTPTPVTTIDGN